MSKKVYKTIAKEKLKEAIAAFPEYSIQEILYAINRKVGIKDPSILEISNKEMYNAIEEMIKDEKE